MSVLNKEEARTILEKVVKLSKADHLEVSLDGGVNGNIRYARNTVTTSGIEENLSLGVTAAFGKKTGTATINELNDASLEKVVRRAEELAQLSPESPEYMEPLGPQMYDEQPNMFVQSTADIDPEFRAEIVAKSIEMTKAKGLVGAGFMEDGQNFSAIMNSKGLFAYERSTGAEFTLTVRTKDATGSGWVTRDYNDISKFDIVEATEIAMQKAAGSANAKAIEPGKYTVILEPAAAIGLLSRMFYGMSARPADEGRNYMSKKGGGTKVGEQMLDERVSAYSDPFHPEVPASTWSGSGLPVKKMDWIRNGVVQNLHYGRYWANEKGVDPIPFPTNIIMEGGDASIEDMIKSTKRGILVTRLWYIRSVDPQTLLNTGLTRDGTFYIENGKIKHPVKNFRFNESPIIMLNNLEMLGKPQRIDGNMIPPMKIRDFTFTSLSDAI